MAFSVLCSVLQGQSANEMTGAHMAILDPEGTLSMGSRIMEP